VLAGVDTAGEWDALIAGVPGLQRPLSERELDTAVEAVADFTDLRSPCRVGHSRGVASLAAAAGDLLGLPIGDLRTLRRAGLVHDIGMHGVPATILDKPGPLHGAERERMRMSAYYTGRTLARPPALARIGAVASLASERLDGSGYHRGLSGAAIPVAGRILAAADAFHAMIEPRPYRAALTTEQASAELRAAVRRGQLAADAVHGVLTAAGQRPGKRRSGLAGLTPRDVEVLPGRPRRLHPAGRPSIGHHREDHRNPHRTDLRQDRRVVPLHRHVVRAAARAAGHPEPDGFVGQTPDDAADPGSYRSSWKRHRGTPTAVAPHGKGAQR